MDLKEIIKNFKDKKILVIGDLMLDRFVLGDVSKISPEAPVPVFELKEQYCLLGGAGNVASSLRALGLEVCVSGIVGDDDDGREILNQIKNLNVGSGIIIDNKTTTVKTRIISKRQQLLRIDKETIREIDESTENKIIEYAKGIDFDVLVFSDYMKGVITPKILSSLRELKKKIIIGPKINISYDYSKTILIINQNKIEDLLKMKILNDTSLKNAGFKLTSSLGCESVVITRGGEGIVVFDNGGITKIPAFGGEACNTEIIDTVIDTVMAAFSAALSVSNSIIESAKIANFAAGIKAGKTGTGIVTKDEIEKVLYY